MPPGVGQETKRHPTKRFADLHDLSKLMLTERLSVRELAVRFGIAPSQVSRDMAVIRKWWRKETVKNYGDLVARHGARLELLWYQAQAAFAKGVSAGVPDPSLIEVCGRLLDRIAKFENTDKRHAIGRDEVETEARRIAEQIGVDPDELIEQAKVLVGRFGGKV